MKMSCSILHSTCTLHRLLFWGPMVRTHAAQLCFSSQGVRLCNSSCSILLFKLRGREIMQSRTRMILSRHHQQVVWYDCVKRRISALGHGDKSRLRNSGMPSSAFLRLSDPNFGCATNDLKSVASPLGGYSAILRPDLINVSYRNYVSVSQSKMRNSPPDEDRANWDSFGTWENRIQQPILLQQSIKHGIPIPKISISDVGQESLTGRRLTNEDRVRSVELAPNLLYFGIYDGHGGAVAADFACRNMEEHIEYWTGKEHNLQVVLSRAFEDIENRFARHLHMELKDSAVENSGTTATVCLLRNGNELVVGSVGDSRAILCRKGKAIRLTRDHEPENDAERERIEASKGFISWNRVGKPLVNGALSMTRSIGDGPLKRYGVIAQPETKSVEVKHGKDSMLVLVTDGIISVMNDQEICDSIGKCHDPPSAANFVADQALQFGSDDNASIIVVPLGRWGCDTDMHRMHNLRWFERSKF